ncbi:MAG: FadR family transcriptional regulator [Anaerolineales bacterium]|nr:FadR family transcriptional regulator [Anaerolineales bacterium]
MFSSEGSGVESEMLFTTVGVKDSLVERVVANIQQLIVDGQLAPGTRLPPERELAERIGVSRTALREAVRILVARGLLETRHGVGTVVREVGSDQFLEPLNLLLQLRDISIDQLHQVRLILEIGIVKLAAANATEEDLMELRSILDAMGEKLEDIPVFVGLDDDYHRALARATHNPLLEVLAESIGSIMHAVRLKVHQFTLIYAMAIPDHWKILAAVAARDPQAAADAMQRHLDNARRFQEEYLALERVVQPVAD